MSFADAQTNIEVRFNTNFTACDIRWENVNYDPQPDRSFAEINVVEVTNERADIGTNNPLHRTTGLISVNIYTAKNIGSKTGRTLADTAAAIFRDETFSGITCRSPLVRNVGEFEEYYVVNMTCEFFRDEIH